MQTNQVGTYGVFVFNSAGAVASADATLVILIPVAFSLQPVGQIVLPGTNVTLSSLAMGTGVVRYQWRFEGSNILAATNASYSFSNAAYPAHHGNFSVVVTDDLSSLTSSNAFIFVSVKPGVSVPMVPVTVLQGGNATYSITATGAPPLTYRWLRNGAGFFTNTLPTVTISNVLVTARITVVVVNQAGSSGVSPGQGITNLFVLADFDRDGMADGWELQYGFSTNNAADALLDFDGDGMINRDEYVAGTNPTNALSRLNILLSATNATTLQFVAQTNIGYTVQFRTNLGAALWSRLTNIPASPLIRTVELNTPVPPGPIGERYYRIVTPPVP